MDQSIKKKYNYWQWKTLIVLMIGYALFYFVRKNFSIVMPALESELGLSKAKLGLFLTLNGVTPVNADAAPIAEPQEDDGGRSFPLCSREHPDRPKSPDGWPVQPA